jgi:hypothetical protein
VRDSSTGLGVHLAAIRNGSESTNSKFPMRWRACGDKNVTDNLPCSKPALLASSCADA